MTIVIVRMVINRGYSDGCNSSGSGGAISEKMQHNNCENLIIDVDQLST